MERRGDGTCPNSSRGGKTSLQPLLFIPTAVVATLRRHNIHLPAHTSRAKSEEVTQLTETVVTRAA